MRWQHPRGSESRARSRQGLTGSPRAAGPAGGPRTRAPGPSRSQACSGTAPEGTLGQGGKVGGSQPRPWTRRPGAHARFPGAAPARNALRDTRRPCLGGGRVGGGGGGATRCPVLRSQDLISGPCLRAESSPAAGLGPPRGRRALRAAVND